MIFNKIKSKIIETFDNLKTTTLYYPGCLTSKKLKQQYDNYKDILHNQGIKFITIKDMPCCGMPFLSAGDNEGFDEQIEKVKNILEENKIERIITNCPQCAFIFKKYYNIDTKHITEILKRNKIRRINSGEATYLDPCYMANHLDIVKEPRELLTKSGYKLKEPIHNKENCISCGACSANILFNEKTANVLAKNHPVVKSKKTTRIITTCPHCYLNYKTTEKEVIEFSDSIAEY